MTEYSIPLSSIYEEGKGKRVEIEIDDTFGNDNFYLLDRTGDTPDDLVSLRKSEIEELAHVCLAYLNRDKNNRLTYGSTATTLEKFRTDTSEDE